MLRTRWSQSGKNNIAAGWRQWHAYCLATNDAADSAVGIDVLNPTPCQLVDFLRVVRKGLRREGDKLRQVEALRVHYYSTAVDLHVVKFIEKAHY